MLESDLLLPNLVARWSREAPERVFTREVKGPTTTYAGMHDAALRLAAGLASVGVGPGDRVVTMLPTATNCVWTWLGLAWLKAIDIACNTEFKGHLLEHVISISDAEVIIVAAEYLDRLVELPSTGRLRRVIVTDGEPRPIGDLEVQSLDEVLRGVTPAEGLAPPAPWDTACVIFTSGTTGPSKGVINYWGHVYAGAAGMYPQVELRPNDVFYAPLPMYHAANRYFVYCAALAGGEAILKRKLVIDELWPDIEAYGVTASFLFPPPADVAPERTTLRMGYGANLPPGLEPFLERHDISYSVCYSMTELSLPLTSAGDRLPQGSCGRVRQGFPGYELRVVDEHDQVVPPGTIGELIARVSEPWCVNGGYLGMPEQTVEAWRNGWFHTGDAFTVDADGNFTFVDRQKDAIRRRAENISSFEVELYVNQHPEVLESGAVAVPDDQGVEDEVKVAVVRMPGSQLSAEDLITFLVDRMPRFMIPRYVEFVDTLPKTEATLRIQKAQLRAVGVNDHTWDRKQAGVTTPG